MSVLSTPTRDGIQTYRKEFDPESMAHDSMSKLYRLADADKKKHLKVALQLAYEMGVEDGAKDETYFDKD